MGHFVGGEFMRAEIYSDRGSTWRRGGRTGVHSSRTLVELEGLVTCSLSLHHGFGCGRTITTTAASVMHTSLEEDGALFGSQELDLIRALALFN